MIPAFFYLSLGSNIGERAQYLQQAIQMIEQHPQIEILQLSSIYETDPVGYVEQDPFLNMVIKGETLLQAEELFQVIEKIEVTLGRKREIYWGPRTIDVDILLYNNIHLETEQLVIPHPRMKERTFVLIPLAEIEPELVIPGENKQIQEWVDNMQGEGVHKWRAKFKSGESEFELFENLRDLHNKN